MAIVFAPLDSYDALKNDQRKTTCFEKCTLVFLICLQASVFFLPIFFISLLVLFLDSRGSCAIGVLKLNSWGPASPILSLRVRGQLSPPTPLQRLAPKKLLFDIFSIFYSNVDKVLGPETSRMPQRGQSWQPSLPPALKWKVICCSGCLVPRTFVGICPIDI